MRVNKVSGNLEHIFQEVKLKQMFALIRWDVEVRVCPLRRSPALECKLNDSLSSRRQGALLFNKALLVR